MRLGVGGEQHEVDDTLHPIGAAVRKATMQTASAPDEKRTGVLDGIG